MTRTQRAPIGSMLKGDPLGKKPAPKPDKAKPDKPDKKAKRK